MEAVSQWLVELSRNNRVVYALVTVAVTGLTGVIIAAFIELLFKLFSIRTDRTESH